MLVSSAADQTASRTMTLVEENPRMTWAERGIAIAYGASVSVAMLGWMYALLRALAGTLSWAFS